MKLLAYIFMFAFALMCASGADSATGGAASSNTPSGPVSGTPAPAAVTPTASGTPLPQTVGQWICAAALAGIVGGLLFFSLHRARKRHNRDAKDLTSAQLGIIAVAVGGALAFGGAMLSKHDPILDLIVAAVTSVLVIQIAETLRSHHLTKRMQSLERALDSETTYSRMDDQLNDLEELSGLLQKHPRARPLFDEFLADAYNGLHDSLESFSTGTISVDDTARELTFNKDCLQHLAQREVWAVSYQDGTFWDEPEGKDFLSLHDEKIRKGVVIHRIFLLTNKELAEQREIIRAQVARKIECRILLLESASGKDVQPEDFVIYDEAFVRAANLVAEGPTTTLKRAVLSCDARKVRDYLQKRNDFKTRSEPAADVLARPIPVPVALPSERVGIASEIAPAKQPSKPSVGSGNSP